MPTAALTFRRWGWISLLLLVLCAGCGLGAFVRRPPQPIKVAVNYLPYLVKGVRPQFPPTPVLVLTPVDKREPYPVQEGGILPASEDNTAILGIWGINVEEGTVRVSPLPELYPTIPHTLGAQRRMKAGIANNPDLPHAIFTLTDLPHTVQNALENHFHEAGFPIQKVDIASPVESAATSAIAPYALGCAIEQFSLVSLERVQEVPVLSPPRGYHILNVPIRGPTRAQVVLALTLYRWPSGEVLWEGKVADAVDDPPLEEHEFLYATPDEVLSMALSRAVGSILVNQELQDVLLTR